MDQKLIMENWRRFKDGAPEVQEEGIWTPNHYCIHHGGVQLNGKTHMAEAVGHNYDDELGRVTHYNMKLEDGTILENVAAEDIQVTNASLAEGHSHKRDDDPGAGEGETFFTDREANPHDGSMYGDPEGGLEDEEPPAPDEFTELEEMSDSDLMKLAAALEAGADLYDDEW